MKIPDESERARKMAFAAFGGPREERDSALELFREFSFAVSSAAERELDRTGDVGKATAAAVEAYQEYRQDIIDYRLRKGLPVEGEGK